VGQFETKLVCGVNGKGHNLHPLVWDQALLQKITCETSHAERLETYIGASDAACPPERNTDIPTWISTVDEK
jgi:hypothetical protein